MRTLLLTTAALAAAGTLATTPAQAACGDITVGEMDWGSAAVIAQIHRVVLELGYGCSVEIVPTSTVPNATTMTTRGEPDIATEVWANLVPEIWQEGIDNGIVENAGRIFSDGAFEGWMVPGYFAEAHPDVTTVADALANAELFAVDGEAPRFNNCPDGWGCKLANDDLFVEIDAAGAGFENFHHGSGGTLAASIERAFSREDPWLGYYWGPTEVLGQFEMVLLDWPEGGPAYPASDVFTGVAGDLSEREPAVHEYTTKASMPASVMNEVLGWGAENDATAEERAVYFLQTYQDLWTGWVTPEAADAIVSALEG